MTSTAIFGGVAAANRAMHPAMHLLYSFPEPVEVAPSESDCYLVLDLASQIGEAGNKLVLTRVLPGAF